MKIAFSFIFIFLFLELFAQEKKEVVVETNVSEATVFINGAQVTRKKTLEVSAGKSVLKFVGCSPYMDSKSVQVKANGDVMVLSVNQQFNYQDSTSRSRELVELGKRKMILDDKQKIERTNLEIISDELSFLKENRVIGGKNQEVSLNNLRETGNFYRERTTTLKMKEIEIFKIVENLNTEIVAIENQIKQIGTIKQIPVSEVIVKIDSKVQTKCDFEISYFVNNVGWNPSYDIRAKSIDEPIELIYKANIHQNTKEEWKNIKLRLSSANPNSGSVAPQLQTYFLNYNSRPPKYSNLSNQVSGRVLDGSTNEPLPGATITIRGSSLGTVTDASGNYSLAIPNSNSEMVVSFIGFESQTLPANSEVINVSLQPSTLSLDEVVVVGYGVQRKSGSVGSVDKALKGKVSGISIRGATSLPVPVVQVENQTSVEFEIKTLYTINSDNKSISVDIDHYNLDVDYEYYCVPKVDKDAFLLANIKDWEKLSLLEGEANIFFENTYVGKSILDVRYVTDTLSLSLGRDRNVNVKREKVKDMITKQFIGNKKEESRAWHISVKNNKKLPIKMVVFDQVPVSTNEDIEVTVENISGAALNKEKGEVKWNFELEPTGKKDLELKYKVKYPKERILNIE